MSTEETVGCPPIPETKPRNRKSVIVVDADGNPIAPPAAPSEPVAATGADVAAEPTAASASDAAPAPRRRGRPPGSGRKAHAASASEAAGPKQKRPRKARAVSAAETVGLCKVEACLRFTSVGPTGNKVFFDRVVNVEAGSAKAAAEAIGIKLGNTFKSWEELYLQ